MTPFSAVLRDLCLSRRVLQKALASELGVDPSYLSALANGRKGRPTEEILRKLEKCLALTEEEQRELRAAVKASQLRYRMPDEAVPSEHYLVHNIFAALGKLRSAQIDAINAVLKL